MATKTLNRPFMGPLLWICLIVTRFAASSYTDTAEDLLRADSPLGNAVGDINTAGFEHGDPLTINDVQAAHRQSRNRRYKNGYAAIVILLHDESQ